MQPSGFRGSVSLNARCQGVATRYRLLAYRFPEPSERPLKIQQVKSRPDSRSLAPIWSCMFSHASIWLGKDGQELMPTLMTLQPVIVKAINTACSTCLYDGWIARKKKGCGGGWVSNCFGSELAPSTQVGPLILIKQEGRIKDILFGWKLCLHNKVSLALLCSDPRLPALFPIPGLPPLIWLMASFLPPGGEPFVPISGFMWTDSWFSTSGWLSSDNEGRHNQEASWNSYSSQKYINKINLKASRSHIQWHGVPQGPEGAMFMHS